MEKKTEELESLLDNALETSYSQMACDLEKLREDRYIMINGGHKDHKMFLMEEIRRYQFLREKVDSNDLAIDDMGSIWHCTHINIDTQVSPVIGAYTTTNIFAATTSTANPYVVQMKHPMWERIDNLSPEQLNKLQTAGNILQTKLKEADNNHTNKVIWNNRSKNQEPVKDKISDFDQF
jgi:hypothetical protein